MSVCVPNTSPDDSWSLHLLLSSLPTSPHSPHPHTPTTLLSEITSKCRNSVFLFRGCPPGQTPSSLTLKGLFLNKVSFSHSPIQSVMSLSQFNHLSISLTPHLSQPSHHCHSFSPSSSVFAFCHHDLLKFISTPFPESLLKAGGWLIAFSCEVSLVYLSLRVLFFFWGVGSICCIWKFPG